MWAYLFMPKTNIAPIPQEFFNEVDSDIVFLFRHLCFVVSTIHSEDRYPKQHLGDGYRFPEKRQKRFIPERKQLHNFLIRSGVEKKSFRTFLDNQGIENIPDSFPKLSSSGIGYELINVIIYLTARFNDRDLGEHLKYFLHGLEKTDHNDKKIDYLFMYHNKAKMIAEKLIDGGYDKPHWRSPDTPNKCQLNLDLPPQIESNINYYGNQTIEVLGRKDEQQYLRDFLNCNKNFAWMQLAGVAGQGKSRLAYELILEARENSQWSAGLLEDHEIERQNDKWDTWQPDKPYLIVIDYVIGRTNNIRRLFKAFARRMGEFQHHVRLLLLERQPWNKSLINKSKADPAQIYMSMQNSSSEFRAEWFLSLTDRYDGNDRDVQESRFESGVFELTKLNGDILTTIVRRVVIVIRDDDLVMPDIQIKRQLKHIDKEGRPLFAYFLAQELAHGINTEGWTRNDLLTATLERERRQWWTIAFGGKPPSLEDDTLSSRIAVLATMTKTFLCNKALKEKLIPKANAEVRRQALTLTGGETADSLTGPSQKIHAMQPDLLGEWFVISSFDAGLPVEELAFIAWQHSSENMSSFMQRLGQDFSDHPVFAKLLDCIDLDTLDICLLGKVAHSLLVSLLADKTQIPEKLIQALEVEAKAGDPRSMSSLGWCYLNGVHKEKNIEEAYKWYIESAEKGCTGGLHSLGWCFHMGLGVEENMEIAIECYTKAAEGGDVQAMYNLGWCFSHGKGVDKDYSKAADWYTKAARSGHLSSMNNLAEECLLKGNGVPKNEREAFEWFNKAANLGKASSMGNLASCYQHGIGTMRDLNKACDWYEAAAKANNFLPKEEEDLNITTQKITIQCLCKKSDGGDIESTYILGWWYRYGNGVGTDINKAVILYEQATLAHKDKINKPYE